MTLDPVSALAMVAVWFALLAAGAWLTERLCPPENEGSPVREATGLPGSPSEGEPDP